jgi:cell division protein FtsL
MTKFMTIPSFRAMIMTIPSTRAFGYCILACAALAGAMYIWQVNISATQGYAISDLNNEITVLQQQNEQLEHKVSSLKSVESVTTRVQMLGLVKINDVRYINPNDAMAVNK